MNYLNQEVYNQLLKANEEACQILRSIEAKNWYEITYDLFKDAPINTIEDLWKIVAYTYSWMPTVPEIKAYLIKDPDKLLKMLQALKNGDESYLPKILEELIPVVNNSLVGASKVLHFIAPQLIPIIDRNVMRGWNIFFFKLFPNYNALRLPNYKTALNSKHVGKYLLYKHELHEWCRNTEYKISLRDLETAFFELGKNFFDEEEIKLPKIKIG